MVGMTKPEFINYVLSFYGKGSDLYDMGATREQVEKALDIYLKSGADYAADSFDREHVRDILIERFGLKFPEGK